MKAIALIADIHANAPALTAVLAAVDALGVDGVCCAGDVVGYNALATETIGILRDRHIPTVAGNHDLMVVGRLPVEGGPRARRAVLWTRRALSPDDLAWLSELPTALRLHDGVVCTHATLRDTRRRLVDAAVWRHEAQSVRAVGPAVHVCVHGHSHRPGVNRVSADGRVDVFRSSSHQLTHDGVWFVNPGSVGEPRDADWRASFAVLEWPDARVTFHRVRYARGRVAFANARRFGLGAAAVTAGSRWIRAATARLASGAP